MKKFPYWIIPLTLLIFVVGLLIWLYSTNRLSHIFADPNQNKTNHNNFQLDNKVNYVQHKITKEKRSKFKEDETENINHKEKRVNLLKKKLKKIYLKGVIFFKKGNYKRAALSFLNYIKSSQSLQNKKKSAFSRLYLAYSLLFLGSTQEDVNLIERSKKYFLSLYKTVHEKHRVFPKIILGLARSSRILEDYPDELDMLLKENLILASSKIKKHLYLELGYFYFKEEQVDKALAYFKKSNLPIANEKFYHLLLEKPDSSLYLLTLLNKNMIPEKIKRKLKLQIQKKVIRSAKRCFKEEKKEEAYFLLKKLLIDYPYDPIIEEAFFHLAELYNEDLQYKKALYYYDKVLSNEYFDLDAVSLFKKGLIYYRSNNYNQALKNFNIIREDFVSTKYYEAAKDWINEIHNKIESEEEKIIIPEEIPKEEKIIEKKTTIKKRKKEKDIFDENIFLKEEIPEEEIY